MVVFEVSKSRLRAPKFSVRLVIFGVISVPRSSWPMIRGPLLLIGDGWESGV